MNIDDNRLGQLNLENFNEVIDYLDHTSLSRLSRVSSTYRKYIQPLLELRFHELKLEFKPINLTRELHYIFTGERLTDAEWEESTDEEECPCIIL
ncbi:MAG: hypothetical protein LW832_03550 [Parachlamydia sp.]|jgi:hypothetical protein|nr:hypothetical protein [Parachlamydia sp.]